MPVVLDVGTDNPALLKDPNYLGLQQPRLKGQAYNEVVDEFMAAMKHHFPRACVQVGNACVQGGGSYNGQ